MGHERSGARGKYVFDEQTIRDAYSKAFEFLTINGIQTREDMKKLREEMTTETVKNAKLISDMAQQIKDLRKLVLEIKTTNPQLVNLFSFSF